MESGQVLISLHDNRYHFLPRLNLSCLSNLIEESEFRPINRRDEYRPV